ncbi:MAG: AAA family ATPase [Thiomonas sp.]
MKTIALFSQKGGCGKTTITAHLAVAAELSGLRVAVLDLDPQGSMLAWHRTRGATRPPVVVSVPDGQLDHALDGARHDGFDWVLMDSPPSVSPLTAKIVRAADLVLVPVRPSPIDVSTIPATMQLVGSKASAFVLSACPLRAPEVEETRSMLERMGRPVFGPITDRRAFFRAMTAGQSVNEFEPGGAAASEILALLKAVTQEVSA